MRKTNLYEFNTDLVEDSVKYLFDLLLEPMVEYRRYRGAGFSFGTPP